VLVCVIDSGVDAGHPEFEHGPTSLDGCKEEDEEAPAGCPFEARALGGGRLRRGGGPGVTGRRGARAAQVWVAAWRVFRDPSPAIPQNPD
jgi:hypothetical protein